MPPPLTKHKITIINYLNVYKKRINYHIPAMKTILKTLNSILICFRSLIIIIEPFNDCIKTMFKFFT